MNRNSTATTLLCGAASALIGGFYVLQGLGVIAMGETPKGGPWMALVIGGVFGLGGLAVIVKTLTEAASPEGGALQRLGRAAVDLMAVGIAAGLTAIGAWTAFGPGERGFASPFAAFGPHINEIGGRIAFGVGAVIGALITLAMIWRIGQAWASRASAYWPPFRKG